VLGVTEGIIVGNILEDGSALGLSLGIDDGISDG